ncbi:MAG: EAL domain-containing protein [Novosphingobium sp.]|nr:EAL domain-containing protein [Novosphingobium sp.]MCP5400997.1 EAL domain-containing protein [Novosphingobium sp.]
MEQQSQDSLRTKDATIALAYKPIIRGYFAVAAAYYGIMTLTHFWLLEGSSLALLASVSSIAFIAALIAYHLVGRDIHIAQLEILTNTINLLVVANVLAALHVEFSQLKLVYFIMMAMIFAFASVSMRQAMISIGIALVGLFSQAIRYDAQSQIMHGFVGFAAAISAVAIAYFLRRAIGLAIADRQQADHARAYAETRLAEALELSEKMRLQSMSDSLTGLPNRRAYYDKLTEGKLEAAKSRTVWLILLDLDGFKAVNDNYGHLMGDELLKSVADRLRSHCTKDAHVSRIGGDEFSIIYFGDAHEISVENWCSSLLDRLAKTYLIEDRLIRISGSIGCCRISSEDPDSTLMQKADFALLHAKKSGKNRVVLFEGRHAEKAAEHFMIEKALRAADFDREIELVFQPQYHIDRQEVVCVETLARWNSPSIGKIGPEQFIRIAEETGLIANITLSVFKKAIAALDGFDDPVPLSVNLSANDLNSNRTIDDLIACLDESNVRPELIEFEITETAMMTDAGRATANLRRLSKRGHSIALDDFGTGFSNFSYLRTLPIDKLKVDRSFLENKADPMTERILHSLVGMARTLEVHCLLEGIESELDMLMAKRVGAQSVQGYLFGMPLSADEMRALRRNPPLLKQTG